MSDTNNDRLKTLLPALSLGLLTAAFIIAKTGRDALFFQGRGLLQLPIAYIMMGTAALPLAMIFVKANEDLGRAAGACGC